MAITKERKEEILKRYQDWLQKSQAVILVEYTGSNMKVMDNLRARLRDSGAGFHVVKNTLAKRAFANSGIELPEDTFTKSTAISFAFSDPAATAKALADAMKGVEFVKVKAGFMAGQKLSPAQVKSLAEMPPLPVMRARLLGTLQAPAGQLVRTLAEPARGLAAVIKAHSEKAPAAA